MPATALSARCVVCSDEPNSVSAVVRMAAALSLTLDSSVSACGRNAAMPRRCRTPLVLFVDGCAFLFGVALFGDVLVRGQPSAIRQGYRSWRARCGRRSPAHKFPLYAAAHVVEDLLAIGINIAGKQARSLAHFDKLSERATGFHDIWRQAIHLEITAIEHDDAGLRVEHIEALRHVVERGRQPRILRLNPAVNDSGKHEWCR